MLKSIRAAFAGVARTVATQRNMKLHVLSAIMVCVVTMALPFDLDLRVSLLFAVALVFFAEILNSGLEALVDLFIGDFHRLAMTAKDAAAGGVLVLSVAAMMIFAEIIYSRWDLVVDNIDAVTRSVTYGAPLVANEAFGLFVVRRRRLAIVRGLLSFAIATPLVLHSEDPVFSVLLLSLLTLALAARTLFPARQGRGKSATSPGAVVDEGVSA